MPLCFSTAVPTIKTLDQDLVTDAGKPFVMTVPYNAYPHAEAEWFFDSISLPKDNIHCSTDRTEYRLKDPNKSEEGRYKIIIQNKHGKGEAFINLKVVGGLNMIFKTYKQNCSCFESFLLTHESSSADVPGPVKNLQVVDTADGEVSIAWEEPDSDGGSKILAYVVERRNIKRKTWTLATDSADSTEYCVTGLQKDSKYLFRVCARNRVGSGPSIETDKAVQAKNKFGKSGMCFFLASVLCFLVCDLILLLTMFLLLIDVPDPPQNVIVENVNKFGATVSWEPPLSDGGSEITSYIIELRDRTSVNWAPVMVTKPHERTAIINDVIENKEYIFRVKAENRAGIGKPSAATNPVKIMDPIG